MAIDEEYLQKLMRTIAHDMGGTLRTAVGFSSLILDNHTAGMDEKVIKWLTMIKKDGEKTQEQLIALSRYARLYGIDNKKTTCDLTELCQKVIESKPFEKKDPDLSIAIKPLPTVIGHKDLWDDLFTELLTNFSKHAGVEEKEKVACSIFSQEDGDNVAIIIEDNGKGLTEKQIAMAVMPYRTVNDTSNPGVGIGLSIVKRIVEIHDGTLRLESSRAELSGDDQKAGLRVIISLPKTVLA